MVFVRYLVWLSRGLWYLAGTAFSALAIFMVFLTIRDVEAFRVTAAPGTVTVVRRHIGEHRVATIGALWKLPTEKVVRQQLEGVVAQRFEALSAEGTNAQYSVIAEWRFSPEEVVLFLERRRWQPLDREMFEFLVIDVLSSIVAQYPAAYDARELEREIKARLDSQLSPARIEFSLVKSGP